MVTTVVDTVDEQRGQFALSYSIRQFEGPLDLLLHLIQKAQISIYDIPISEITDQFLQYLRTAESLDLDDLTEFYAMAAHLIYMKGRMLIPQDDDGSQDFEFDQLRGELVERLLEYQKFKRYSLLLDDASTSGELFIQRRKSQFTLPFEDHQLWNGISVWDLLKTFSGLLKSITTEHVFNVYEEVTTKQKLTLMAELFEHQNELTFLDIVVDDASPMHIIAAFLAVLEAVKYSMITIHQHVLFGDIVMRKRLEFDADFIEEHEEDFEQDYSFLVEEEGFASDTGRIEHSSLLSLEEDDEIVIAINDEEE